MDYREEIVRSSLLKFDEAKKIFFNHQAAAFYEKQNVIFDIKSDVANRFKIPFSNVYVAGSAQIGFSVYKHRPFSRELSDIDIAIVDPSLFSKYVEYSFRDSASLSDRSVFPTNDEGRSKVEEFCLYLGKGWFRPDLMPYGPNRRSWFAFFNSITKKYQSECRDINAGIFLSEYLFLDKQADLVADIRKSGV